MLLMLHFSPVFHSGPGVVGEGGGGEKGVCKKPTIKTCSPQSDPGLIVFVAVYFLVI